MVKGTGKITRAGAAGVRHQGGGGKKKAQKRTVTERYQEREAEALEDFDIIPKGGGGVQETEPTQEAEEELWVDIDEDVVMNDAPEVENERSEVIDLPPVPLHVRVQAARTAAGQSENFEANWRKYIKISVRKKFECKCSANKHKVLVRRISFEGIVQYCSLPLEHLLTRT